MKEGPFKRIAQLALSEYTTVTSTFTMTEKTNIYKISLGNSLYPEDSEIYRYCIDNNVIAHGFGNTIDFNSKDINRDSSKGKEQIAKILSATEDNDDNIKFASRVIWDYMFALRENDLVFVSNGNYKLRAIGKVTGPYYFKNDTGINYNQFRDVEWIVKDIDIPVEQVMTKIFSQQTLYYLSKDIIKTDNLKNMLEIKDISKRIPKNYVLIIDEINRGNIPRIFGELITLLEEDKRLRLEDQELVGLRVDLPNANDSESAFGVPRNLFIIGTMNTADKSLTTLDLALRRRFAFEPMYPRPDLIENDELRSIFIALNTNIKNLKGKDFQLGHSFFMNNEFEDLPNILNLRILPLLEEYFYNDTEKVKEIFSGVPMPAGIIDISENGFLIYKEK
jgi:5-methylcytosine-specific restriction protein B